LNNIYKRPFTNKYQAGPNGAVAGSQWACRETFVAIIVTNLPIIQPLIRKGASMIGLSVLFSRGTKSASQSHQLRSSEMGGSRFNTSRRRGPGSSHPLATVPQTTAWASDEHILPEAGKPAGAGGGIVVAQEISVQSEATTEGDRGRRGPEGNDWGYKTSVSRSP